MTPSPRVPPSRAAAGWLPAAPSTRHHAPGPFPERNEFGSDVHALLEHVAWVDESPPALPTSEAGKAVANLLRNPALHEVFERRGRSIELFREQAVDAIIERPDC